MSTSRRVCVSSFASAPGITPELSTRRVRMEATGTTCLRYAPRNQSASTALSGRTLTRLMKSSAAARHPAATLAMRAPRGRASIMGGTEPARTPDSGADGGGREDMAIS